MPTNLLALPRLPAPLEKKKLAPRRLFSAKVQATVRAICRLASSSHAVQQKYTFVIALTGTPCLDLTKKIDSSVLNAMRFMLLVI